MYVVFAIVTAGKPDFPKPFLIRKLQRELDTVSLIHPSAPVRLAMNVVADIHLEQESRAVMSEPDFRTQILAPFPEKMCAVRMVRNESYYLVSTLKHEIGPSGQSPVQRGGAASLEMEHSFPEVIDRQRDPDHLLPVM